MSRAQRGELAEAAFWIALGMAALVASWRMDRLESLGINPLSAPGLVPGLLGALMMVFGAALGLRALVARAAASEAPTEKRRGTARVALALLLCVGYAGGLLGRGLPFWLTSAAFLFIAMLVFRFLDGEASPMWRTLLGSAGIAAAASAAISVVFQEVFLVRLP